MSLAAPTLTPEQQSLVEERLSTYIEPLLDRHQARIIERPYEFYNFVVIEYQGERISLHRSWVTTTNPKALRFFLENYGEAQRIIEQMEGISDPFYSTISNFLDSTFGKRRLSDSSMVFSYICDRLTAQGKRIWS